MMVFDRMYDQAHRKPRYFGGITCGLGSTLGFAIVGKAVYSYRLG